MKNIFTAILFLSVAFSFGQDKTVQKKVTTEKPVVAPVKVDYNKESTHLKGDAEVTTQKENSDYSQIFTAVQVQAIPPGGMNAYRKYISSSFKLPEVDQTTKCNIVAKFVVWDDGSIRDIMILKEEPYGLGLGKEYVRLLKESEKWTPGFVNGKSVKQFYTMPIAIQIQGSDEDPKPNKEVIKEETPSISENNIVSPEKQAEPIGGIAKFYKDLSSKIQVPEVEVAGNYKTKVKFVVNQDGSLSDYQVLEETPSNVGLGQNVIKYLQSIENWTPSEQNGKKVKMYFVLPVTLNIEPESVIKKKD